MSEVAATLPARPDLDRCSHAAGTIVFSVLLLVGLGYTLGGLIGDIEAAPTAIGAFVLLGIANQLVSPVGSGTSELTEPTRRVCCSAPLSAS